MLALRAKVTGRPVYEDLPEAWAEPDESSGELSIKHSTRHDEPTDRPGQTP